ncbi:MAG: NAD(P)/FAD-dependent oxidoreductase [Euryarchaeota archaeon]|nr:NAD(P)/FAD-dependent oxidoreductase [Euryarchaeota archaeon]
MIETDVLIVGAGISGLNLAGLLEEHSVNYRLLEKRSTIGKHGNRIVNMDVVKSLSLPESLIKYKIQEIRFVSPNGTKLERKDTAVRGVVVDLFDVEKMLADRISKTDTILFNQKAIEVNLKNNLLITQKEKFKFKLLIGAYGITNWASFESPKKVLCHSVQINTNNSYPITVFINSKAKGFYGWIMPLADDRVELGIGSYLSHNESAIKLKEKIFQMPGLEQFKGKKPLTESTGIIPVSIINNFYGGNFCLIGDANGGEAMMGASIHKCLDESKIACDSIVSMMQNKENYSKKFISAWTRKFYDDISEQQKMRKLLDETDDDNINAIFYKLTRKKLEGTGLINALFKNIVMSLRQSQEC